MTVPKYQRSQPENEDKTAELLKIEKRKSEDTQKSEANSVKKT